MENWESTPKRPRTRRFLDVSRRMGQMELPELCQCCGELPIEAPATYFALDCGCSICPLCFSKQVASNGSSVICPCTSCNMQCFQWKCNATTTNGEVREHHADALKPDPQFDPVRFHESYGPFAAAKHIGISFSSVDKATGELVSYAAMYDKESDPNDWDEEQTRLLQDLFMALHSLMITNDSGVVCSLSSGIHWEEGNKSRVCVPGAASRSFLERALSRKARSFEIIKRASRYR